MYCMPESISILWCTCMAHASQWSYGPWYTVHLMLEFLSMVWSMVHCTSHARGHLHGMVHGTLFIPCYGSWYIVHVHPICIILKSYTVHLCIVSMLTLYRLWSHVHSMYYYQLPVISLSIVCYCMIHVTVLYCRRGCMSTLP